MDWRWALGDEALALESIRHKGGAWDGVLNRLEEVATRHDVPLGKLRQFRGTAAAWPPEHRRHDVSFTVHYILRGQPDRFELIAGRTTWTTRDAKAVVGWAITQ